MWYAMLAQGLVIFCGPCLYEVVDGLDVVNDDLVTRIYVAFAVDVICDVKQATAVMSKVLCHGLP